MHFCTSHHNLYISREYFKFGYTLPVTPRVLTNVFTFKILLRLIYSMTYCVFSRSRPFLTETIIENHRNHVDSTSIYWGMPTSLELQPQRLSLSAILKSPDESSDENIWEEKRAESSRYKISIQHPTPNTEFSAITSKCQTTAEKRIPIRYE